MEFLLPLAVLALGPLAQANEVPGSGGGCSTVCSVADGPSGDLSEAEFLNFLLAWQEEPVGVASLALETLLFYGADSQAYLRQLPDGLLDPAHRNFLSAELSRNEVRVEMRLVDDQGEERGILEAQAVPLGKKQHLRFQGGTDLGVYITSGRVKRVGLSHLWSRW